MHEFGILHRDMKIENIMMTSNDEDAVPKLVDFGLSHILR
jgi:serine/threonine protein kinase